jgi:hypothetical protein
MLKYRLGEWILEEKDPGITTVNHYRCFKLYREDRIVASLQTTFWPIPRMRFSFQNPIWIVPPRYWMLMSS